jgi:hypothetical protein
MPSRFFDHRDEFDLVLDPTVALLSPEGGRERSLGLRAIDPTTQAELVVASDGTGLLEGTIGKGRLYPGTVEVLLDGIEVAIDDGAGAFLASESPSAYVILGTVDYDSGAISISASPAPALGVMAHARFRDFRPRPISSGGQYEKGDVVFPNMTGTSIREMFGFVSKEGHRHRSTVVGREKVSGAPIEVFILGGEGQLVPDTSIKYQLSVDGGTTWQFWNTSSPSGWDAGDDTDATFSPATDIAAHISTLSFSAASGTKQLRVKARLFPSSDGLYSPQLYFAALLYEHDYSEEEDFKRSLVAYLNQNLRVREAFRRRLTAASSVTLDLSEGDDVIEYSNPVAYNLTTDPGRTTPLGVSVGSPSSEILFTSPQTGDVEILADATWPVFIRADGFTQLSTTRAILLTIARTATVAEFDGHPRLLPGSAGQEFLGSVREPVAYPIEQYRVRPAPSMLIWDVGLLAQHSKEVPALQAQAAIRRLMETGISFPSLAVPERYIRVTGAETALGTGTEALSGQENDLVSRGLAVKRVNASFSFWAQTGSYDTIAAVRVVEIGTYPHDAGRPPTLRSYLDRLRIDENDMR